MIDVSLARDCLANIQTAVTHEYLQQYFDTLYDIFDVLENAHKKVEELNRTHATNAAVNAVLAEENEYLRHKNQEYWVNMRSYQSMVNDIRNIIEEGTSDE